MQTRQVIDKFLVILKVFILLGLTPLKALELDWSGQFWSEMHYLYQYTLDPSSQSDLGDAHRAQAGGYYIPGAGKKSASFQTTFLRLRPKLIVNDNIYIKSEWWFGSPIFGIWGNALPYSDSQRQYDSSQSRGFSMTAQRLWGEFVTDWGTLQIGRVPLHWGLGVVWNAGEGLWDRYLSTGDALRWFAKLGAFTLVPSVVVVSSGSSVAGTSFYQANHWENAIGSGGVTDYSFIFKYDSLEEDFEVGIHFLKRLAGYNANPDTEASLKWNDLPVSSMNVMTYDLFARKRIDRLTLSAEVPWVSGHLGNAQFKSYAVATEVNWRENDSLEWIFKTGYAPGQSHRSDSQIDSYQAFYFHNNYRIAMILFNYQLANLGGPQTQNHPQATEGQLKSPYDNPIVDAFYFALAPKIRPWDKWILRPALIYAFAPQTAVPGKYFYQHQHRKLYMNNTDQTQGSSLGWELDLGITFQWDDYFQFNFDNALFVPGSFYSFSNTAQKNRTSPVFATALKVGVNF